VLLTAQVIARGPGTADASYAGIGVAPPPSPPQSAG
jgi:hypothetical protein